MISIKELKISGYRSLKDVQWQPGDLNVIIGPNGSGKSNLLRTLEMISAASNGHLGRYIQDIGGINALLYDDVVNQINVTLGLSPADSLSDQRELVYRLDVARSGNESAYRIEREEAYVTGNAPPSLLLRGLTNARYNDEQGRPVTVDLDVTNNEEPLLLAFASPSANNNELMKLQATLGSWRIYHDINVGQDSGIRKATVTRFAAHLLPRGQNLVSVLHTLYTGNRTFKDDLNAAMTAAFGNDFEELTFPPDLDGRVQLKMRWKTLQREQSAADLSDGILRFLYLITVLANPSQPSLIAIDEPETGLHPDILPIVAEFATFAASKTQVVFTTNSPQFLDALEMRPTVTVAEWENGETKLSTLDDDQLEYLLKEYSLGKLFMQGHLENMA